MDADLQHPPEAIAEIIEVWESGADVVACRRVDRDTDSAVMLAHGLIGLPVLPSHGIAFIAVNVFSYFLNSFLVFHRPPRWASYLRFLGVSLFSLVSTLVIAGICEMAGLDYRIGLVAVVLIAPPITYLLQKSFTFRAP